MDENQKDKSHYPVAKALIGLGLVVPAMIFDVILGKQDPALAYSIGLFLGMSTGYLLSPEPPKWKILLPIAVGIGVLHFVVSRK